MCCEIHILIIFETTIDPCTYNRCHRYLNDLNCEVFFFNVKCSQYEVLGVFVSRMKVKTPIYVDHSDV